MTPVAEQFAKLLRREVHYLSKMPDSPLRRQVPRKPETVG